MRATVLAVAGMLVLAATSGLRAQQTSPKQDDQFGQTPQTTGVTWSSPTAATPTEQTGDFYQGKGREVGNSGSSATPDNILPEALNPDANILDNGRQPDPRY